MGSKTPLPQFQHILLTHEPPNIYIITLNKPPENRLNSTMCQELIQCIQHVQNLLDSAEPNPTSDTTTTTTPPQNSQKQKQKQKPQEPSKPPNQGGCLITTSFSPKFFTTGLDLDEPSTNPHANTDGFFPLLATLLDFPYPTIALLTGHTFGGACPFALAHDFRIMNSTRGFFSMPPVDLGLHFDGIGALPRLKLKSEIARKMLLEGERWTSLEAKEVGIVDEVVEAEKLMGRGLERARELAPRGRMGVYGLLRGELYGEALEGFKNISYRRSRVVGRPAVAKI